MPILGEFDVQSRQSLAKEDKDIFKSFCIKHHDFARPIQRDEEELSSCAIIFALYDSLRTKPYFYWQIETNSN